MANQWSGFFGIVIAAGLFVFIHRTAMSHVNVERGTKRVFLTAEVAVLSAILTTYALGELFKIGDRLSGKAAHLEITIYDCLLLFGALFSSLLLYLATLYVVKKE